MTPLERELARMLGDGAVLLAAGAGPYDHDSTEMQGLRGKPDAVVAPDSVEGVVSLVSWCAPRGLQIVPRGGGSGFAGGAVPTEGGIVCSLERLNRVRSFEPLLWRVHVDAGVTTARLSALARESGLMFPPNPGAPEQSQIGGNIATNAGGPRSFKYGVTGVYVTGIEAVVGRGELIRAGGPLRKDVAGYDLCRLMTGSEGTLGIIVGAWLKLVPAPEDVRVVLAALPDEDRGVAAMLRVLGSGVVPATLEFFDRGCVAATRASLPCVLPEDTGFLVMAECDGSAGEARRVAAEVGAAIGRDAIVGVIEGRQNLRELDRWREGVGYAVRARRGGKMSEDVAVPLDMLATTIRATVEIGERHGLAACSWGHAGDGNVHATFMIDPSSRQEVDRAWAAAEELFDRVLALGGSVSGEHGLGWVKAAQFERQFGPAEVRLQRGLKAVFDPAGIFNRGKKVSGPRSRGPGAAQ